MAGGRAQVATTLAIESTAANGLVVGGTVGATAGTGNIRAGTVGNADVSTVFTGSGSGLVSVPAASLTGQVAVANGGTGVATLAAHGLLIGNGASAVAVSGAGTTGQVLTSNGASADPTFQAPAQFAAVRYSTIFEDLARQTLVAYGGGTAPSVAVTGALCTMTGGGGAASGGDWSIAPSGPASVTAGFGFSSNFVITAKGTDGKLFVGPILSVPTIPGEPTLTSKHFGFKLVWASSGTATLSATQADGTTESASSLLTGIIQSDLLMVKAQINPAATGVTYYYALNGAALSAGTTITTNFPTGAYTNHLCWGCSNTGVNTTDTAVFGELEVFFA